LPLLVQDVGSVLCRCELIRTRPNEFGPTARIRRRDLNGYHSIGAGGANRLPPFLNNLQSILALPFTHIF